MARRPRVVTPGSPHNVTQRGNGQQRTFFEDGDYALYLDLLAEAAKRARTEIWAYCLMPNHVHIVLTPSDEQGLARLVARPEDWRWSSVRAHLSGADDHVVRVAPALERVGDFRTFLGEPFDEVLAYASLRRAESVGRPVGSAVWLGQMETRTGRRLTAGKRGPIRGGNQ